MHRFAIAVLSVALLASCGKKAETTPDSQPSTTKPSASTPAPATQDISTEALVAIDTEIQKYQDAVDAAKKAFDANDNTKTRGALAAAYTAFGNYMVYDSPVTPRKGKYRRALVEYRRALALDPGNATVKSEIQQIESIYREMGRPIPSDPL